MATDVVMPQMGESLAEGTVTKWLKQVGDRIERDEPLFEISTDKVDSVIPAPAAGYLAEIRVAEGTTVDINSVVAVIDAGPPAAGGAAPAPAVAGAELPRDTSPLGLADSKPLVMPKAPAGGNGPSRSAAAPAAATATAATPVNPETGRVLTSPLVKRIAREESIDLRTVPGSGSGGRVTRRDVEQYLEARGGRRAGGKPGAGAPGGTAAPLPVGGFGAFGTITPSPSWLPQVMPGDRVEPMTRMRELIAQHMTYSKHVSPHVYTVFEFDLTRLVELRSRNKARFEQETGVKLTFMPFILRATVHALRKNPVLNASVRGNEVIYHHSANVGIAVDLNPGLIVPVVKQAEEKSFLGLARTLADLADRARRKQLALDEVQGGTFTITNPGVFGSLFGCPVINQPQVAILDVGGIVKRPVVISGEAGDTIGIRSMCLMSVAYDHRVVDGASADHFMNDLRDYLENWDEPLH